MVKLIHIVTVVLLVSIVAACTGVVMPSTQPLSVAPNSLGLDAASPLANSVLLQTCRVAACEIGPVDSLTGQPLSDYPVIAAGRYAIAEFSSDRKTLAVVAFPDNQTMTNGVLKFVDLQNWWVTTTTLTLDNIYETIVFSPDDHYLTVIAQKNSWPTQHVVQVIDVMQGTLAGEFVPDFMPHQLRYTPDGQQFMLYGTTTGENTNAINPTSRVALIDATTLQVIWQQTLDGVRDGQFDAENRADPHTGIWWQPAVVFDPQQPRLYIAHADQDKLTIVDFGKRHAQTVAIAPAQTWIEQLLALTARTAQAKILNGTSKTATLSPDGRRLYVTGVERAYQNEEYSEKLLGIQVIDPATGVQIAYIDNQARSISVAADGTRLYLHGGVEDPATQSWVEWTEVIDAGDYSLIARLEDHPVVVGQQLDGQPLFYAAVQVDNEQQAISRLDPIDYDVLQTWSSDSSGWQWFVMPR